MHNWGVFHKNSQGSFSKYICIPKKRPLQLSIVISREKMLNHLVMVAKLLDDNKLKTSLKKWVCTVSTFVDLIQFEIERTVSKFRKKRENIHRCVKLGSFTLQSCNDGWKNNVQKSVMNEQSYCFSMPIAFLPISLLSRPSVFKLLIVVIQKFCYHGNETSHFSLYHCHFLFLYSSSFLIMFISINLY